LLDPVKAVFAPAEPTDEPPAAADTVPADVRDSPAAGSTRDAAPEGTGDTADGAPLDPGATSPSDQRPAVAGDAAPSQPDFAGEGAFVEGPIEIDETPVRDIPPVQAPAETRPQDDVSTQPAATATAIVPLAAPNSLRTELALTLREGEDELAIDLVRQVDLDSPLSVRLEEVGYTGNRSPWESGRYRLSNNGIATFEPGEARARVTVSMPSDDVRDPDVQAGLLIKDLADTERELALINLVLEDDDQRSFESTLAPDTVGFSTGLIDASERDPALQIDVLRYNPGNNELEVRYFIAGGSATEGDDYFLPGATALILEPRQRSARLLIPLVQDSVVESDETFILELRTGFDSPQANIFRRIEVIIRDDDG
jgi:hypothetical protein